VDPTSFEITGHAKVTGVDHESNVPVAIAATGDAVWVRVDGKVVELARR
jgi:hypothetical protein